MSDSARIHLVLADITTLDADAIVTSANAALAGGGGVDAAIHRAAGPELMQACLEIGGCLTGEARITPGFDLQARYVIHAVGPIYMGGERGEDRLLASAYTSALQLCEDNYLHSVAFPCISTGAYEYPPDEACQIAVETVSTWLVAHDLPQAVTFCCYEKVYADQYTAQLGLSIRHLAPV